MTFRPLHVGLALACCAGALLLLTPALAHDDDSQKGAPKNLKVLPKDMSRRDVNKLMKQFNKGLGVKCAFCHNTKDYASDEKPHKEQARAMMRMTEEIHAKYFSGEKDPNLKYNCFICHRGHDEPRLAPR